MQRMEDKLNREQAARDALMREVMATRQQQVAAKLQGAELDSAEAAREHEELLHALQGQQERRVVGLFAPRFAATWGTV